MNIIGLDSLNFGTDDVASCNTYFTDFGLIPENVDANGGTFKALDGTSVVIRHKDDPSLPPPLPTEATLRKTIYGCADRATVDAIADELGKDREVNRLDDGSIEAPDDLGFMLGFQVTERQEVDLHDDTWVPRQVKSEADASQIFHFSLAKNWQPGQD